MKKIPVFIHHEVDQKPQTGGAKKQRYVFDCAKQAAQYNQNVILLGDASNQNWGGKWVDVSSFRNEKWEQFLSVFCNLSTYPDTWAISFFKRFFVIEDVLEKMGENMCVILDSDVLVWQDFSKMEELDECDCALGMPQEERLLNVPFDDENVWVACAGVSYFKKTALTEFLEFCINMYKNHVDLLNGRWKLHQEYGLTGGICEMTLLYLWVKANPNMIVNNLYEEMQSDNVQTLSCVIFNQTHGTYDHEEICSTLYTNHACIRLKFENNLPYICRKADRVWLPVKTVHFGGKSKVFIKDVIKGKNASISSLISWYYWELRGVLSMLKRWVM